jgi:hypothetical protein
VAFGVGAAAFAALDRSEEVIDINIPTDCGMLVE